MESYKFNTYIANIGTLVWVFLFFVVGSGRFPGNNRQFIIYVIINKNLLIYLIDKEKNCASRIN